MKILSNQCIRRVNGVRCDHLKVRGMTLCEEHLRDTCIVCSKLASLECKTCGEPLCGSCQHHESFGH